MLVWAPDCDAVSVRMTDTGVVRTLVKDSATGWHSGEIDELAHGVNYELLIGPDETIPDPLGRWLPDGVFGVSRWWDPASFQWHDEDWTGRNLYPEGCIYELHIGTFTAEGTLDCAAGHLDYLADLGVTHVELMPLAAFDGDRGWGYDGVALNAVHQGYGGPDALCRFVDAAHQRGLAVLLDVVYNHFGPVGNNWGKLGPFVTDKYSTPWGGAINLDAAGSDQARKILVGSAQGWIRDFHLDGLRLDAVHALVDDRALTFLEELGLVFNDLAQDVGRSLDLIAESDRCDPRTITASDQGGLGMDAQWNDDIHHVLHWLLTGEDSGYYADYASAEALVHAFEHGFWLDGRWSSFRDQTHGQPLDFLYKHDPFRLVVSLQTHDQVGNREAGDRLSQLVSFDHLAAGAALLLSLPYTPMLFMGEEWGASTPWQFFTSFTDPELAQAVTEGRAREFARHGWHAETVPDPQSPATFAASTLDWSELDIEPHAALHSWYRELLQARRAEARTSFRNLGSATRGFASEAVGCDIAIDEAGAVVSVTLTRPGFVTVVNLGDASITVPLPEPTVPTLQSYESGWEIRLAWPSPQRMQLAKDEVSNWSLQLDPGASAVLRIS